MTRIAALTDKDMMPWGKYQGELMEDVPAEYLLFLYDGKGIFDPKVNRYVLENINILRMQVENNKKGIK